MGCGGQEVRLFAGLNALIKLSDHSGRDKEVMPPASLMLAAFALCSAINCHGAAVAGYLTNLASCHCMVDKCSDGVRTTSEPLVHLEKKKRKKTPDDRLG